MVPPSASVIRQSRLFGLHPDAARFHFQRPESHFHSAVSRFAHVTFHFERVHFHLTGDHAHSSEQTFISAYTIAFRTRTISFLRHKYRCWMVSKLAGGSAQDSFERAGRFRYAKQERRREIGHSERTEN